MEVLDTRATARERSRRAFDAQASEYDTAHWGDHARRMYPAVIDALVWA